MAEPEGKVIVCAGPPLCNLVGDEAIEHAANGCLLCKRLAPKPDGSWIEEVAHG